MSIMWRHRLAARLFPWHIDLLDKINANALVRQWIAEQRDRIPAFERLHDFYRYVHDEVCDGTSIDFLEFGVYRGHSIRLWSEMNRDPYSRFIGFDSFVGLPESWTKNITEGAFDVGGEVPQVDDERVRFVRGWFQSTLPAFVNGFTPRSRLVIHNDSDLYSSTLFTLVNLHRFLSAGTVIIFDEYSSAMNEFRAFTDYKHAFWRSATPVAMTSDYARQVAFIFN
jgi:O-methyltransferase